MALSSPATRPSNEKRIPRNVSVLDPEAKLPASEAKAANRKRLRPDKSLTRQVSHEAMSESAMGVESDRKKGRGSPCRCVSEFDTASSSDEKPCLEEDSSISPDQLRLSGLLRNSNIMRQHRRALKLEAELFPMRLILARLMAHSTHNRRGIFNSPVDHVALKLPDYTRVIKKPMDLGSIKARLHAVAYKSRKEAAEDIRLVFHNAMQYNPPNNLVHVCARELLAFFEEHVQSFVPDLVLDHKAKDPLASASVCRDVTVLPVDTPKVPSKQTIRIAPSGKDVHAQLSGPPSPRSVGHAHIQGTRAHLTLTESLSQVSEHGNRKRKKRGSKVNAEHSCQSCEGRACGICEQGCLHLEPTLLICNGAPCAGARIRKGGIFFIAPDGSRQYCQRCYMGLPAVLPGGPDESCCYKRDLLKRRNDEEVVESWAKCEDCSTSFHKVCVMRNEIIDPEEKFSCPSCHEMESPTLSSAAVTPAEDGLYSFLTGEDQPVPMASLIGSDRHSNGLSASALPETPMSRFIERKVADRMCVAGCPNAEKTVSIRVISDCSRFFEVPEVIQKHFKIQTEMGAISPPNKVGYRSKSIALFQRVDGLDVCIFCMYVQEYDGNDTFDEDPQGAKVPTTKRTYIAYLDSVEHFRPRVCRTEVYHEVLVAYLASARKRGYESAHIWACPPIRGNSFVFWNHPSSQRTPTRERLISWYCGALSRAISCGVVTGVKSLYESSFQKSTEETKSSDREERAECPPLFDGDFWIEEALRLHGIATNRISKSKNPSEVDLPENLELCPARQVAFLLRRLMADPVSMPFRKPVNAAALNLKDYHKIISKPMDLGTVHSRCLLGEYRCLKDLMSDFDLIISNAKRYNPKGHFVHSRAEDSSMFFHEQLNSLAVAKWGAHEDSSWKDFLDTSLNLDYTINLSSSSSQSDGDVPISEVETKPISLETKLSDGPKAVEERMVGEDKWMMEKKTPTATKATQVSKRKKLPDDDQLPKRRRQTWLGDEVGQSVRRMRTSFFTCLLTADVGSCGPFDSYVDNMDEEPSAPMGVSSSIVDARHGFLEFSQLRNLEFDTLRRAKYSTATLLYYLHNTRAPGAVPRCGSCSDLIEDVRWHKVGRVIELRRNQGKRASLGKTAPPHDQCPGELCASCHSKHSKPEMFIPLQVTLRSSETTKAHKK